MTAPITHLVSRFTAADCLGPAVAAFDSNTHAYANAIWSWTLRGDKAEATRLLAKLTQDQRDAVMEAAVVLVALAGEVAL